MLAGCSTGSDGAAINLTFDVCQPIAVAPGGEVDAARLASIDHALAMWNGLGATELSRASDAGEPGAAVPAAGEVQPQGANLPGDTETEPQVIALEFQGAAAMFHGFYDDQRGIVYINQSLGDDHQRAVTIAHELGHAFGLVHVPASERASVMNPGNLTVEPTADDAAALTAFWGACPRD